MENHPDAFFAVCTGKNLASGSALPRVSSAIRKEFLPLLLKQANIIATVRNFDFGPLITFLNRISDREFSTLASEGNPTSSRRLVVELQFTKDSLEHIGRWINRFDRREKREAKLHITYVRDPWNSWVPRSLEILKCCNRKPGVDSPYAEHKEVKKIIRALEHKPWRCVYKKDS